MAKPYIVERRIARQWLPRAVAGGAPWGGPGGYPYIPPTYGYGGTYIYPLYVPMGVPIYTYYICVCAYAYIPTIYMYVHMLIYIVYMCMCKGLYIQCLCYTNSPYLYKGMGVCLYRGRVWWGNPPGVSAPCLISSACPSIPIAGQYIKVCMWVPYVYGGVCLYTQYLYVCAYVYIHSIYMYVQRLIYKYIHL